MKLRVLTGIEALDYITGEGLKSLAGFPELEALELDHTKIDDTALISLKAITKLRRLELGHTSIIDEGVKQSEGLKNLRTLDLFQSPLTPAGYTAIRKSLPETLVAGD